ncbi:MAG: LamG domain-containing protein, partial [Candidatus Daviesbacteria bacterium]|nr:LamG domain-containing protein [Candidatus Daviesbacteria bacterium]
MGRPLQKLMFILSAFLVAGIGIFVYSYFFAKPASASWFNESWLYRKAITITVASSASDITDLETLVTVDTSATGKFQSSCQDLRFTNVHGDILPYYIDSGCGTSSTKVWVLVDLVPKSTTTYTMYMYYGNPSAPSASDSTKFRLFNGLVGYWTMNEASWAGAAGEVKDLSVNANNGQAYGNATTTSSGKYSYGGTFDGTGDYVDVGSDASLGPSNTITIAGWIYVPAGSVGARNDWIGDGDIPSYKMTEGNDNDHIHIFTIQTADGSFAATEPSAHAQSAWYHIVGTYDKDAGSNNLKLYSNGTLIAQTTATGALISIPESVFIGKRRTSSGTEYTGTLDDIRIYNRALTLSEVEGLYTTPGNIASNATATAKPSISVASEEQGPGPVGYWKFDDAQGLTAQDSSSSNNDGTLSGTTKPTWQTENQCVAGQCLYFDGSTSSVNVAHNASLEVGTSAITTEAWIKTTSKMADGGYQSIIGKGDGAVSPYKGYYLRLYDSDDTAGISPKLSFFKRADSGTSWTKWNTTNTEIAVNQWYHVAAVDSGDGTVKFYVNGSLIQTVTGTNRNGNSGSPLTIGDISGGTQAFPGFIDEPKVYPYARTAAQIKTDYNAGKANAATHSGTSAALGSNPSAWISDGLVGYWKMDEASGNLTDSSGNSNTGTINGTTVTAGKFGNSRSFDGNQDYATVGDQASLEPTNLTISYWAKTNDYTANLNGGISKGYLFGGGNEVSYTLEFDAGITYGYFASSNTKTGIVSTNIGDNNWHLWTYTYDGS